MAVTVDSNALNDGDKLSALENMLHEAVIELLDDEEIESEDFSDKYGELFRSVQQDCVESTLETYKETAPIALADIRDATKAFEDGNFARWKQSFDHLEMLWTVCQEVGELQGRSAQGKVGDEENVVMAALSYLFPRALLVAQEVICLLKGGFPDGALTRWRSLHELNVTAMFIAKHGIAAAVPYLLSFHFHARRAARQMNEYSDRADITSISDCEMADLDARCAAAEAVLGRKIDKDKLGDWPAITQTHKTFAEIEKDVGMDHWRPYYKWASTHTHAHHRPIDKLLGMAESSEKNMHLVGPSNSGFVNPFEMTALTLAQITSTFLLQAPNLDRIVHSQVVLRLAEEMADIAIENERRTREEFEASDAM